MEQEHKHHIIPIYRCKELKLTTSYKVDGKEFYFKENLVKIPREQHALIHWGYWCKDLSPLLEHCNPPQWVIDMIPLGDKRDSGAAGVIALGEIDGIDMSGENHPRFGKKHTPETKQKICEAKITHGRSVGAKKDPKIKASYYKENYANMPPEEKEELLREQRKEYAKKTADKTDWVRGPYKKKTDRGGEGTLDAFFE